MPVLYKPFQSNLEDKKSGKKLFYPHVVRTGNINSAQLSKEIAAYSSLSPGDVKNTLDNLVTVMAQHLQSSESVSVDGLGTFRMVMSARGRGVETADEVSAAQATLTVRFQPTTTKNLDRTTATRSMVTGAKCAAMTSWSPHLVTADRLMIRITSLVVAAMAEMMEKHRTRQYNLFLASREEI